MNQLTKFAPFLVLLFVYLIGAFCVDIMDIDAAQYANISREMAGNNQFLEVQYRGVDYYLDKPPLLFWGTALVFKLFGVTGFAYRLLPILSTLLGMFALYRFAKLYYSDLTAYVAALVMGSCQAFFLMNHDVRADTLLANCVMVAIWQIAEFRLTSRLLPLVVGSAFVGLAMLAKGPIGLIVPGVAFFTDFVLKREWRQVFRWEWLLGAVVIGLVLTPYCLGLYRQYGNEGLYFFFWKQSFGRITGESEWDNSPGLLFQAQNFLWSFLPWVLVFVPALWQSIHRLIRSRFRLSTTQEAISLAGFLIPFAALSTAHYQLPHYTFVVFPLAALLTADYLVQLINGDHPTAFRWVRLALIVTAVVMGLLVLMLCTWAFPLTNLFVGALIVAFGFVTYRLFAKARPAFTQLVLAPFLAASGANFALNLHIYPTLLTYQTSSVIGKYVRQNTDIDVNCLYKYDVLPDSEYSLFHDGLDFYTNHTTPILRTPDDLKKAVQPNQPMWLYTEQKGLASLQQAGIAAEVVQTYNRFHVTGLTLPFLNPATRSKETTKQFLVRVR